MANGQEKYPIVNRVKSDYKNNFWRSPSQERFAKKKRLAWIVDRDLVDVKGQIDVLIRFVPEDGAQLELRGTA